ncbi:unnamed protein product [Lymnaea stagnalis]|uniref:Uncharacterized protein n=1 Tax=Lymnaea stagnalis TaxID=6523 RepID=A0AAV2H7E0_LYMST
MAMVKCHHLALVVLALVTLPANPVASSAPSKNLLNFMSVISGRYVEEILESEKLLPAGELENLTELVIPVRIPAFDPDFAFLYEETVSGTRFRRHIFVVSENADKIITIRPYNITGNDVAKDLDVASLESLPLNAFSFDPDCALTYRPVSRNTYFGTWPDCTISDEGVIPFYSSVWTCDSENFLVLNEQSLESRYRIPYIMRKYGPE